MIFYSFIGGIMDCVFVRGLKVATTIGVYSWEKDIKQTLIFDIDMGTDIRAAASGDAIDLTVDYSTVSESVTHLVQEGRFELIETVAEQAAELIIKNFPVKYVEITLQKPGAVRTADTVGVKIRREA